MIKSNPIPTWRTTHNLENNNIRETLSLLRGSEPHLRLPSLWNQQKN